MAVRILNLAGTVVRVYEDADELALKAARRLARLADQYVLGCGRFTIALSGGTTPRAMFELLSGEPFLETVPWSRLHFFWGDERAVPPDHPESNYRMAREALLSKAPIPPENIHRWPAEDADPARAAASYESSLRDFFGDGGVRFDLILLGMGADGHTASLFPHTPALKVDDRIAVENEIAPLATTRLTLTAATINDARNVTFLVAGSEKAPALSAVLNGPYEPDLYPSQLIRPARGALLWMIDEAAAASLSVGDRSV
jgi:6-phosphogluconolactonase